MIPKPNMIATFRLPTSVPTAVGLMTHSSMKARYTGEKIANIIRPSLVLKLSDFSAFHSVEGPCDIS
jgi:hypothetical protein